MLLDADKRGGSTEGRQHRRLACRGLLSMYGTGVIYGSTLYDVEAAQRSLDSNASVPINSEQLTGQTAFDDVRAVLERLENPETDFASESMS